MNTILGLQQRARHPVEFSKITVSTRVNDCLACGVDAADDNFQVAFLKVGYDLGAFLAARVRR